MAALADVVCQLEQHRCPAGRRCRLAVATVPAAIDLKAVASRGRNREQIDGTPRVYVDPEGGFVQDNYYRLEGALVVMALFGADSGQSWWRVTKAEVARSHQLDNEID